MSTATLHELHGFCLKVLLGKVTRLHINTLAMMHFKRTPNNLLTINTLEA